MRQIANSAPQIGERARLQIVNRLAHKRARDSFEKHRAALLEVLADAAATGTDLPLLRAWARGVEGVDSRGGA